MTMALRVSDDVAAQILNAFYADGLKPGEWLGTEAELAERFGVSRVTIRDALSERVARIHSGILDAVADHDADLARERMQQHLAAVSEAGKHPPAAWLAASV